MIRRLPVYILLDTSGSMYGEPIAAVKNGVKNTISALQSDPHALETAYVSFITFGDDAEQVIPLTEVGDLEPPENIQAEGLTSMGAALELLAKRVSVEVTKTTANQKGDWKPLVFLFTDGEPTDSLTKGIKALNDQKIKRIVACAAGPNANTETLKQITEAVVKLDSLDEAGIKKFFQWVSQSIAVSSVKIEKANQDTGFIGELPPPPDEITIAI